MHKPIIEIRLLLLKLFHLNEAILWLLLDSSDKDHSSAHLAEVSCIKEQNCCQIHKWFGSHRPFLFKNTPAIRDHCTVITWWYFFKLEKADDARILQDYDKNLDFKSSWLQQLHNTLTKDRCTLIQTKRSNKTLLHLVRINLHQSLGTLCSNINFLFKL